MNCREPQRSSGVDLLPEITVGTRSRDELETTPAFVVGLGPLLALTLVT